MAEDPSVTAGKEVAVQGERLGLQWGLRTATVKNVSATQNLAMITFDGDGLPVPAFNMSGAMPAAGARVFVLFVPPQGNYIMGVIDPVWTSYTPAWTSSGVAPVLGNGTATGRYRRIIGTGLVIVQINLTFGGTTTFGTGVYFFSLPVNASAVTVSTFPACGTAHGADAGVKEMGGTCKIETASTFRIQPAPETATGPNWGTTTPFTWGSGDKIIAQIMYEAA